MESKLQRDNHLHNKRVHNTPTKVHCPESPIWDTCITAIEVFYPGERDEKPPIHALIEYCEFSREWKCRTYLVIPGTNVCDPQYSTADIKLMVTNPPCGEILTRTLRSSSRRVKPEKVQRAAVHSVRVIYNGRHLFLDRYESNWQSWTGDKDRITLLTENIQGILSSAVRSPR
jgi:hypothetical protein